MVLSDSDLPRASDVQEFLDSYILKILTSTRATAVLENATWTIDTLHQTLEADALIPPDERQPGIAPRFSLRALEGIVVGIARNREAIEALPDYRAFIRERVAAFWLQPQVAEMSAAGLRGTVRIQRSVPFGSQWFAPNAGA